MSNDQGLKKSDQIALLQACLKFSQTGKWKSVFTYPNCGSDLVSQGLASSNKEITTAGRATLWLLGRADDPTSTKTSCELSLKLGK